MVGDGHSASPEIKEISEKLNREWADLNEKAADKGRKLREATQQQTLNRALEDAQVGQLEHVVLFVDSWVPVTDKCPDPSKVKY